MNIIKYYIFIFETRSLFEKRIIENSYIVSLFDEDVNLKRKVQCAFSFH